MATSVKSSELLTRPEAAQYVGVRPQTLATWASSGRYGLPFVKCGRSVRYRRADLDQWLRERTGVSTVALSQST